MVVIPIIVEYLEAFRSSCSSDDVFWALTLVFGIIVFCPMESKHLSHCHMSVGSSRSPAQFLDQNVRIIADAMGD